MLRSNPETHHAANLFPMMSQAEIIQLAENIKQNGLREPISFFESKILDGRNRAAALELLGEDVSDHGVDVDHDEGVTDPVSYVISKNIHRRQLKPNQRALIAARLATLKRGDVATQRSGAPIGAPSIEDACLLLGVGRRSVDRAKHVIEHAHASVLTAIESGELSINLASKLVDEVDDKQLQLELVAQGKQAIREYITPPEDLPEPVADKIVAKWEKSPERITKLKEMIQLLKPHEIQVLSDWFEELT